MYVANRLKRFFVHYDNTLFWISADSNKNELE